MVSDLHKVMGSQFSSTPPPNLFDQIYDHTEIYVWRGQKEVQPTSSGGPLNLGDPYDRSLSEEEVKYLIPRFENAQMHSLSVEML